MTPLTRKFSKSYAKELIRIAEGDLKTAKVLMDHPFGRPENTFFLLQQTVEKSLKALLCHHNISIPLTHDLAALLAMLPTSIKAPEEVKALLTLTEFASIRRYEEGSYEYSKEEAAKAYQVTHNLLNWVKALLEK